MFKAIAEFFKKIGKFLKGKAGSLGKLLKDSPFEFFAGVGAGISTAYTTIKIGKKVVVAVKNFIKNRKNKSGRPAPVDNATFVDTGLDLGVDLADRRRKRNLSDATQRLAAELNAECFKHKKSKKYHSKKNNKARREAYSKVFEDLERSNKNKKFDDLKNLPLEKCEEGKRVIEKLKRNIPLTEYEYFVFEHMQKTGAISKKVKAICEDDSGFDIPLRPGYVF